MKKMKMVKMSGLKLVVMEVFNGGKLRREKLGRW